MIIAILKSEWDGMTERQRQGASFAPLNVKLGVPALFEDTALVEWAVFDDGRLTPEDLAYVAAIVQTPTKTPTIGPPITHRVMREIRAEKVDLTSWLPARGEEIDLDAVIAAQGASANMKVNRDLISKLRARGVR